ncbi:MAG: hypothetical protein MRY83_12655, partial [Flavobacteriales bacterium]|nr:hypothetical protein [Flavobacteriales bacterium]
MSIKNTILIGLFSILAFSWMGCEIINPDEDIPAYIQIDTMVLDIIDPSIEGSASHNISDAWVYVNDQLIGGFELPVTVPILSTGTQNLKIRAGIRNSGLSAVRTHYNFYTIYEDPEFEFTPGEVKQVKPVFQYDIDTDFLLMENFDDPLFNFEVVSGQANLQQVTGVESFEGQASGIILLNSSNSTIEVRNKNWLNLLKGGKRIYLEMDYNITEPLEISLVAIENGIDQFVPVIVLYPTDSEWTKIYLDLTEVVNSAVNSDQFKIQFYAEQTKENVDGLIYLD